MRTITLLSSFVLGCLASAATAQGTITINVAPGWVISQDQNASSSSGSQTIPGAGTDILNVNAFSTTLRGSGNQTQSNVAGFRTGAIAMSGAVNLPVNASFGFMIFQWNGVVNRTVTANAQCTATGQLPNLPSGLPPKINMSGSSQVQFTCGILNGQSSTTISSAVVTAPATFPGGLGVLNKLTKTQGTPIAGPSGTFVITPGSRFFYSCVGDANANATLKRGDNAFFNTNVSTSATINL